MKQFTSVKDVSDLKALVDLALKIKKSPFEQGQLGKHKTLGLIFMNPSLRTRLSTQKAAMNLGMQVMVMNVDKDGWALEFEDDVIMNGSTVEHIREAAAVMGQYCQIIGLRSFPGLKNREEDYSEMILNKFIEFSGVPILSLESATRHPLQSLADLVTIEELKTKARPKVVLAWAPHIKPLPQAVPNSFAEWMNAADVDFTIAHPKGYELATEFSGNAKIENDVDEAIKDADFIYVKNWSSYQEYGQMPEVKGDWLLKPKHLIKTNNAKIMHCLPVRRGLELSHEILDGPNSLVIHQAANREWAAQAVLTEMLGLT